MVGEERGPSFVSVESQRKETETPTHPISGKPTLCLTGGMQPTPSSLSLLGKSRNIESHPGVGRGEGRERGES